MRVETAVNRIIERTRRDVKALNEFEQTFNDFKTVCRGGATNLEEVEQMLEVMHDKINTVRTSILVGLGKMQEEDLEEILSRYRDSATHIYALLDAYAKYDPLYLQQAMEAAEDDTRQRAIEKLSEEVKAEYRELLG